MTAQNPDMWDGLRERAAAAIRQFRLFSWNGGGDIAFDRGLTDTALAVFRPAVEAITAERDNLKALATKAVAAEARAVEELEAEVAALRAENERIARVFSEDNTRLANLNDALREQIDRVKALCGDNATYADFGEPPNEDVVPGVRESDLRAALDGAE